MRAATAPATSASQRCSGGSMKAAQKMQAIGTVTMFGSPVNAQGTANTVNAVNAITSEQGTVQHSTHKDDFVGTVFGGKFGNRRN